MSYQSQAQLEADNAFQQRSRAAAIQQADIFINDQRPDFVAVSKGVLRADASLIIAFNTQAAAGPGIADKVDNGDGTIDQAKVTDADMLSLTQASWPTVAGLFFDADGNRIPNPT
jgi:hypothetical protein